MAHEKPQSSYTNVIDPMYNAYCMAPSAAWLHVACTGPTSVGQACTRSAGRIAS